MTQLEGQHSHLKEFSLRLLPIVSALCPWTPSNHCLRVVQLIGRLGAESALLAIVVEERVYLAFSDSLDHR